MLTSEIKLTPIVDVGLKAILIVMTSPFDMPPCTMSYVHKT